MKHFIQAGLAVTAIAVAGFANAAVVYNVSSTSNVNCGNDPHGLWTNSYNNSGCNEYNDFQDGSTLTVNDDGTARLLATAINGSNDTATIDITFGGFQDDYNPIKNGGNGDPADWDFYTLITDGTISFSNGDEFDVLLVGQSDNSTASSPAKPVMQIGVGANDKTIDFGSSAWLDVFQTKGGDAEYTGNQHWDLNMTLTAVPEPSSLALIGLGLAGVGLSRRKKA